MADASALGPLILIVDDFDDALDIYRQYLTFRGYQVMVATNGDEALAAVRARRPDLILMDLSMPGLSGTDTMRTLRAERPALGDLAIIAFTAHALADERLAALAAGFDGVIAKPCLPDEL